MTLFSLMLDENHIDVGVCIKNVMPLFSFRNKRKQQNSDEKEPEPDSDDEDVDLVDSSDEKDETQKRYSGGTRFHYTDGGKLNKLNSSGSSFFPPLFKKSDHVLTIQPILTIYRLIKLASIRVHMRHQTCDSHTHQMKQLSLLRKEEERNIPFNILIKLISPAIYGYQLIILLRKTVFTFFQIYGVNSHENNHLNTNVSKLNSENEAIKKLIIGGETDSSFFTPGTKRKAERTYSSSSDSEAIETIINNKPFTNRLRKDLLKLVPKNSNFKKSWKIFSKI
ncbi:hypothetical protein BpHYR1_005658 [Brachionus plicatilis]|uniref:Uncharacterized protein n=1 Tax=Brachionus plicatilis TaxID=10195 RepID=A0A3M7PZZ1_BRAPC|nr:hypothetical protein BpHYR1_005658 [Brachionus plicatilis]